MTYLFSPVYVVTLSKYNQQINSNDCRREEMIEFIICRLISMKFFMEHQEKSKVFCLLSYFGLLVPFAGKMSVGAKGSKTSNPNQNWTHWVNFLVIGLTWTLFLRKIAYCCSNLTIVRIGLMSKFLLMPKSHRKARV